MSQARGPIDVHTHWCVFDRPGEHIFEELEALGRDGHSKVVIFVMAGLGLPREKTPLLVPDDYHDAVGLQHGRCCRQDDLESWQEFAATWFSRPRPLEIVPFLDVRAWDGKTDLRPWVSEHGFRGLKDILLLEEDEQRMLIRSLRHLWGLTREQYLERHERTFSLAAELGLPLVYHADLTRHGDFVRSCLEQHPAAAVDIAHLGFSRKAMARLFRDFPSLRSDLAGLEEHVRAAPAAYAAYFSEFSGRLLLGSDSLASTSFDASRRGAALIRELGLPEAAQEAILWRNAEALLSGR